MNLKTLHHFFKFQNNQIYYVLRYAHVFTEKEKRVMANIRAFGRGQWSKNIGQNVR